MDRGERMNRNFLAHSLWRTWSAWFALGIGVKRWLIVLAIGAMIAGTGVGSLLLVLGQRHILPDTLYGFLTLQILPTALRILAPLLSWRGRHVGGYSTPRQQSIGAVSPSR